MLKLAAGATTQTEPLPPVYHSIGVAVDSAGNVYVTDYYKDRVLKYKDRVLKLPVG